MEEYQRKGIVLYLPESFEWIVLASGGVEDKEIKEILAEPDKYIDSREYFSWERFFTTLLVNKTMNSYLKYSKKALNSSYLNERVVGQILAVMEGIELE